MHFLDEASSSVCYGRNAGWDSTWTHSSSRLSLTQIQFTLLLQERKSERSGFWKKGSFLPNVSLRRDSAPALSSAAFGLTWLNSVESLSMEDRTMDLQREAKDTQLEQWATGGVRLGTHH